MHDAQPLPPSQPHIVARLRNRVLQARAMGFQVRHEFLNGQSGTWCEIGGRKTVFVDSSQPAAEQLAALDAALCSYRPAA